MLLPGVDLYWIPLGAGGRSVRVNGILYEACASRVARRPRCELYHSVLAIDVPEGRHWVEMTPVPDAAGHRRGVVATGAVGSASLNCLRVFRYEIRRWRDGIVPDLAFAVGGPVRVTDDADVARRVFDAVARVPTAVWGRDELDAGEMWTCNSVIAWSLETAGLDARSLRPPDHGRAPGWIAGCVVAGSTLAPAA